MAENLSAVRETAVMGPYGPESEPVHPYDRCAAPDPCYLPWAYQVDFVQAQYDTRELAIDGVRYVCGYVGRRLCFYHARLTQLHAERWDLPVRVKRIR